MFEFDLYFLHFKFQQIITLQCVIIGHKHFTDTSEQNIIQTQNSIQWLCQMITFVVKNHLF